MGVAETRSPIRMTATVGVIAVVDATVFVVVAKGAFVDGLLGRGPCAVNVAVRAGRANGRAWHLSNSMELDRLVQRLDVVYPSGEEGCAA